MALIEKNGIQFTGSVGDYSVYRMAGCDRLVMRQKGGPRKGAVRTDPRYARTRENSKEFGGCSTTGKFIRTMLRTQRTGVLLGVPGRLNARLKVLQKLDDQSRRGERHVMISKAPHQLEGFALNKGAQFDAVVASPITTTLGRDTFSVNIDIPQLVPGYNLTLPQQFPMYRLVFTFILVPDHFHQSNGKYLPAPGLPLNAKAEAETPWLPAVDGSPAMSLDLQLQGIQPPNEQFSLLLAVAVQQGDVRNGMAVTQVHRAGAAKILAMG